MFYIRVDANRTIATGHVMRCLAIAGQIRALGEPCTFITADEEAKELIEEHGFEVLCLHSRWDNLDGETGKLLSLIKERQIKVLLLDTYSVTRDYLRQLEESTSVVYMDDIHAFPYPVHTIIHYGISGNDYPYQAEDVKVARKYLLGCDYIPLREEFRLRGRPIKKTDGARQSTETEAAITDVLITTGGGDLYNLAGHLIQYLHADGFHLHVVSGMLNTNFEMLAELAANEDRISLYANVKNMSELMLQCDAAVSAAGTTLYELCACGVPTVSVSFADNQIAGAKEFDKRGIIDYAGDIRDGIEVCLADIAQRLHAWNGNPSLLQQKKEKMQALVDGKGAARIAAYCLDLQREEIH